MALVELENIVKRFPIGIQQGTKGSRYFTALNDISVQIDKGELCAFIGPSGSGKTTLLNIIGSLDAPSEGSATVLGNKVEKLNERQGALLRSKHMGFIFQTYNLLPVYTVYENVEFPLLILNMSEMERNRKVMDALDWVKLTDKKNSRPNQLSGGQSQRVAIARAIVKKPELVLADEPTANLDAENSYNILDTMVMLNKDLETTFIFSTHDEKVIKYLRRKIYLMDGKIVKDERVTT